MVTQQHECTAVFGIPESEIYVLPDDNVHRVLCQQYTGYPYDFGEKVLISILFYVYNYHAQLAHDVALTL